MKRLLFVLGTVLAALALMGGVANASLLGPTWNHSPGQQPYVTVEDHTGSAWPVTATTGAWRFGLHYGRCYNSQCVRVYEANWGRNGVVGVTNYSYYTASNRFAYVTITMNDAYAGDPYSYRYQAVGQELGHSLGLGHDPYADIMYAYVRGYDLISTFERGELTQAYR